MRGNESYRVCFSHISFQPIARRSCEYSMTRLCRTRSITELAGQSLHALIPIRILQRTAQPRYKLEKFPSGRFIPAEDVEIDVERHHEGRVVGLSFTTSRYPDMAISFCEFGSRAILDQSCSSYQPRIVSTCLTLDILSPAMFDHSIVATDDQPHRFLH